MALGADEVVRVSVRVYCNGDGRHIRHRLITPIRIHDNTLQLRCEFCRIRCRMRPARWKTIERKILQAGHDEIELTKIAGIGPT